MTIRHFVYTRASGRGYGTFALDVPDTMTLTQLHRRVAKHLMDNGGFGTSATFEMQLDKVGAGRGPASIRTVHTTANAMAAPRTPVGSFDRGEIRTVAAGAPPGATMAAARAARTTAYVARRRVDGTVVGKYRDSLREAAATAIQAARRGQVARLRADVIRYTPDGPGYLRLRNRFMADQQ